MKRLVGGLAAILAPVAVWASEGWTGGGADTKITTAGNWASATDLTGGTVVMKVTGGTAATLPADGTDYAFKGVLAERADFTFDAEAGAKPVTLGAGGFTNTAGGVTWGWPTVLGPAGSRALNGVTTTAQTWYNAEGKTLAITAPLSEGNVYFQGRGRVDVYSTNTIETAFVGASNSGEPGKVKVYVQPGAQLVKEGGTVNCSCAVGSSGEGYLYGVHLMGGTHKYNFIVGTHNNANPSGFFVEANTTNVIEGSFNTQWGNQSSVGIAGHLTIKGGFSHGGGNAQGGWYPFCNSGTFKNGYLKIAEKPATANRVIINRGTLELAAAGNKFNTRGLYVSAGTLKTTVANAFKIADDNKLQLTGSAVWDLTGIDQGVKLFCGNGGTVTSATAAQLHVGNSTYFFDSSFDSTTKKPASSPALNMGTNVTVCSTVFSDAAGLADDGLLDLYIAAANTSTGKLTVTSGRLILSAANSAEKFPGTSFTKTQGSWQGRVEVTGGTLVIEHGAAFGPNSEVYVSGGSIELAEGVVLPAMSLHVTDGQGGWTTYRGTCGGAASGAAQQPTLPGGEPVFSGTGTICVGATLPDGWPTTATPANWVEQGADKLVTTAANWDPSTASIYDGSLFARIAAGTQAKLPDNDFAFIQGLTVSQPNFSFAPGMGTMLFLGKAGLTNTTTGVVWEWPSSISAFEPLWWLAKNSTMELRAPLAGTGKLKIWGGGRLDVYSTNTIQGTVYVGNNNDQTANPVGEVSVYLHPGATLAVKGGTVSIGCRGGWGLHLMGNTLDCNVIAGTQNTSTPAALFVDAGTTNVINGSFTTQFANNSYMGVAGHLTLRGGAKFQHDKSAAMQRFRPVNAATGTLRIENKPVDSRLCEVAYGRFELATAGNVFHDPGLWLNGGKVLIDADNALVAQGQTSGDKNNNVALSSGTFDLNGHDVQVDAVNAQGGTVTSATPAQFRVKDDRLHSYSGQLSSYVKPYLSTGTVCRTVFTGQAGLRKEGSLDFYIAAVNSSTGTLTVTKGKLVMSDYSASATYPGTTITKSYGAWRAGTVEVTGGTLLVEHKEAFSKDTRLDVAGGTVEVSAGVTARVGELWIDGVKQRPGTYGGSDSGAKNKLSCFTGTGMINVLSGSGLTIYICGGAGAVPSAPTLRFGVLSDVHITRRGNAGDTYSYGSAQTFVHTLQYFKKQNVDAVVLAGDMADRGLPENLQVVADAWREVFPDDRAADGRPVERVFIYGNHDADRNWFVNASGVLSGKAEEEKAALIARSISRNEADVWRTAWGEEWNPAYMKTIKGYHFIAAHWGHESQAVELINEHCFDLAGSKPFFYVQHPQLTDGLYGKYGWNPAAGPTAALASYPNAITFSGHIHYSTSLEASIYQKDFTSIGTASLSYISKFEEGLNRGDSDTTRNGREALLVSVYGNRVVVKRREFVKDMDLGPDWVIEPGSVTAAAPYTYAREQERLVAPVFPAGATVTAERTDAGLRLTLPQAVFDASHARVPFYDLVFKSGTTTLYSCTLQQNGYFAPFGAVPATTTYTIAKATFDPPDGFTLEVRARDFYGRTSAPIMR